MRSWDVSTLLVLLLAAVAQTQDACLGSTCYPSLGDLMVGRTAQLSATSTCGLYEPQRYCILGYLENEQKCFFCDSRSPYSLSSNPNSHRIENIITTFEPERKMRWWQSENGVHQVSIRLDLETIFQFSHLVLTFKSFRPAAMLVERSKDFGQSWKVFRYFAEDCANSFPGIPEGPAKSVHDVICDSRYSGAEPSTDGEVVLKALDPSFDIDDPYNHDIQELITLTNLRVNFTRLLTLGDTLLGRRRRNPQEKYYYALYEMVVRGSCFCHGHAAQCVPADGIRGDVFSEPGMVHGRCVCQHNTAGDNCERCQDFYNDSPWRPGGVTDSVVCGRCNCHGHSESCHFDMERYLASGEVSGGVCDNCRNNRMGAQCELCQPYFYQDPRRSVDDPEACIPCNCDPAGSLSSGPCDPLTGRCMCKAHVEGERCDRCKYGFYGFSQEDPNGCQVCRCNAQGSVLTPYACDPQTGQCICQSFATGPYCDQCMPGHWGLGSPGQSCVPCDCDPGGAYNSVCSSVDGQCECRNHMVGLSCSEPAPGYFLAPLDFYLYEAENASPLPSGLSSQLIKTTPNPSAHVYPTAPPYVEPLPPPVYPTPYAGQWQPAPPNPFELPKCEHYFRERGYDFTFSNGRFVLVRRERRRARKRRQNQSIPLEPGSDWQIIPRQRVPGVPVTWTGPGFVRVRDGAGLRFIVTNVPASLNYHLVIRYEPESSDDWAAIITVLPRGQPGDGDCPVDPSEKVAALPGSSRAAVLDPPVCLNNGQRYNVDIVFRKQANADPQSSPYILVDSIGLIPKIESLQNFCSESDLAQFQRYNCEGLGAEAGERTLPEVCERLIASMSARIHNGAVPCRCNRIGSLSMSCSKFGGQCDCKPNVIGRCCDSCAPLTYGLGPNGCSPCDCDPSGSTSQLCDQRSGQCSCQSEITGRRCDGCLPGYYGFPRCRPCQCNGLADLCDPQTGVCLDCREHSAGPNCDRCVDGYIGDPLAGESCKPCLCPDVKSSGRFFARSCSRDSDPDKMYCECVEGYTGPHCDKCAPGFYGNLAEPGSRCEECPCNNNIDPTQGGACDPITGECLRCLYNTHGPRCQSCKPGYYGNALAQDCKECSCDRRGTEVLQCPMGGPCFCDPVTGQCPCRTGVVGALCNECDDGYWNFEGASGCQPCNCDPEHSLSNLCNKITGQCPCKPEFGGRQCDECGENYFGNPDIQCISCDCNMEGTLRPACDPSTGECMCRPGVTGFFCHECAPGHEPTFPACAPCHACYHLWTGNVTDVKKAAEKMLTLIPRNMDDLDHNSYLPRIQELMSQLDGLNNLTGRPKDKMDEMEELLKRVNDMMDTLDPNMIIIDQSPLLNTDIDNIRRDFKKLLDNLIEKSKQGPVTDPETLIEALEEIRKYHTEFMKDEKRVEDAKDVVEKSIQTRQNAQRELASCQPRDIKALEKKIKALSIAKLNEEICGAPGNVECSEAKCGGALCGKCGGPSCKGSIPVSKNATQVAENTETDIITFLRNLRDTEIKINDVRQMNEDIKDKAEDMMTKITDSLSKFEKEKNDTKDLLKRVRAFLTDEMVEPEDIEQMANAVLAIKLPASPDKIRDMIKDLQDALKFINNFKEDLKPLEKQVETVKDLEDRAKDILDRTKEIGVPEYIKQLLENAEELQDQAIQSLDQAKKDKDTIADLLTKSEEKLKNAEEGLNSTQPKELLDEIEALKNKTEMNKAQAKEAKAIADEVLTNTTDLNQEFEEVLQEFNKLKNRTQDQSLNEEANKRLKDITKEVETLTKDVEDKMKKIEELEKKIQDSIQEKEGKIQDVADLLKKAEYLKKFISDKVEGYVQCKT